MLDIHHDEPHLICGVSLDFDDGNLLENLGREYGATKQIHGYLTRYSELFEQRRKQISRVLEIGVQDGGSIRMWEAYFPNAEVVGLDIDPSYERHSGGRRSVIVGNSTDPATADRITRLYPSLFDIIIDDGSHHPADQLRTLELFFPLLRSGGYYSIEDIGHTRGPLRLVVNSKLAELIDGINYWPREMSAGELLTAEKIRTSNYWIRNVVGLRFYRGISIVEKGDASRPTPTSRLRDQVDPDVAAKRPRFRRSRLRELRLPWQFSRRRFIRRREVRPESQPRLLLRWLLRRW